ncbi:MAG: hypothetical protein R3C61_16575 [Bacteroidia bacterium]
MKTRILFALIAFLPVMASAHDIPVPHDHFGIWSSWEVILLIVALGAGLFFIVRKQVIKNSNR